VSEKWWFDSGLWCNRCCGLFEVGNCVYFVECVATGCCRSHHSTTIWATFHSVKPSAYLNVLRQNLATSDRDFQMITLTVWQLCSTSLICCRCITGVSTSAAAAAGDVVVMVTLWQLTNTCSKLTVNTVCKTLIIRVVYFVIFVR